VFALNKYRLKYQKSEDAQYISHLDFVRTIGRTFKRANLPLKYTQGFNPHIIMSVALPISVGILSDSEYMDIELTESVNTSDLINRINENIPLGLKIIEAKKLTESDKSFNKIDSAKYIVHTQGNGCREIEKLLEMESIEVEKKTKKGISNVDIRKDIRNIEYIGLEDEYDVFIMHLSAGSNSNLKPETVLKAMELYLGYKTEFYKVKRISMYFENSINIF
jgi:radical SAM-linked protein